DRPCSRGGVGISRGRALPPTPRPAWSGNQYTTRRGIPSRDLGGADHHRPAGLEAGPTGRRGALPAYWGPLPAPLWEDLMARILVVEASPDVHALLVEALGSAGHEVLSAHDGLEARRLLPTETPAPGD